MPNVIDLSDTAAARRLAAKASPKNRLFAQLSRVFVAHELGVPVEDLRRASRGGADICEARQAAMYLAHVVFGMSFTAVGREFGRDRSTVDHACEQVEWRREDVSFDALLTRLEWQLRAATQMTRTDAPRQEGSAHGG